MRCRVVPLLLMATLAVAQGPQTEVLRGTVLDASGKPVAGANVELCRRHAEGFCCLDLPFSRQVTKVQTLKTGKNGSFATQVPRGEPFEVRLDDGVHAPIVRREVYGGEDLTLLLVAPPTLVISLVDEDGKAVPGGLLEGWNDRHVRWIDAAIDDHGRWISNRVPVGSWTVDIAPALAMRPEWQKINLVAGETTPMELTLRPGVTVRGRVTEVGTGKPIAGATVGEGWTQDKFVVTDADGRYEMRGYGAPGYQEMYVRREGYCPTMIDLRLAADAERDFQMAPARAISGRILGAGGAAAAGVYVAAVGGAGEGMGNTFDWSSGITDGEGRYRLSTVAPGVAHTLFVRAADGTTLLADLPVLADADVNLPDVQLRAGQYVGGTLTDGDGKPVAGIEVTLAGCNPDRGTLLGLEGVQGDRGRDYCIAQREMRTDSFGRIHFANVQPGTYQIAWSHATERESTTIEVRAGVDPAPVAFTISR
ncbi:MAG: hypothetical protein IPK26_13720 [Planctomycetes bacterium]|nr:hypothetical protein [Planctomycetota bacterium]